MFAEHINEITQEENPVLPRIQVYNPLIGYKLVLFSLQNGILISLILLTSAGPPGNFFLVETESFGLEPGN